MDIDSIEHAKMTIANHQEWKRSTDEIAYGMNCLYATAEAAPLLAQRVIELENENVRLREVMKEAGRLLAEVNTAYNMTTHERYENTRRAEQLLADALYPQRQPDDEPGA